MASCRAKFTLYILPLHSKTYEKMYCRYNTYFIFIYNFSQNVSRFDKHLEIYDSKAGRKSMQILKSKCSAE